MLRDILRVRFSASHKLLTLFKKEPWRLLVDGMPCPTWVTVRAGQTVTLCLGEQVGEEMPWLLPQKLPVPILMADDWLLAVDKPADMPTHPSAGHRGDTLADVLANACGAGFVLHAITRLDRDTSGVVLLARHRLAAAFFASAMARGDCQKIYYAIVAGQPAELTGQMTDWMGRAPGSVICRTVLPQGQGSLAITDYETVWSRRGRSLLRLFPRTGRTHQLRVQLAARHMPIVGDALYGGPPDLPRQALHAASLTIPHPSGGLVTVTAPMPPDMLAYDQEISI